MPAWQAFAWGCGGSIAIELVSILQIYHREPIVVPSKYRRVGFWVVRLLVVLASGGAAVAYKIDNPVLAINIGASAPLIFQSLAKGINAPEPGETL